MARATTPKRNDNKYKSGVFEAHISSIGVLFDEDIPNNSDQNCDHYFKFTFKVPEHDDREYRKQYRIKMIFNDQLQFEASDKVGYLFNFLDALGYKGGYNTQGEWENNEGKVIGYDEIQEDLENFINNHPLDEQIVSAFYPQKDRQTDKYYMNPAFDILPNNKDSVAALEKKYGKAIEAANKEIFSDPQEPPAKQANSGSGRLNRRL